MRKLYNKYKSHLYFKYAVALGSILAVYLAYRIYTWINTEATDNAYIDAAISNISSEVGGVVVKVHVLDNMVVKKGDLIAEIDDSDYKSRLASIEASINTSIKDIEVIKQKIVIGEISLKQSREALAFANTNFEANSTDYKRTVELNKENFASNKILDTSKVNFTKAKTYYNQAQLNLQMAEQNLQLLSLEKAAEEEKLKGLLQDKNVVARSLRNTKLIAPVNGILANSSLQVGNFINPGRILFFIVQDERYIRANFKETQIAKFLPDQKVKLRFDSIPKQVVYGKIRNISPATGSKFSLIPTDNATGNFTKIVQRIPVLIDFELPDNIHRNKLVPGMSVVVSVSTN
ncbi:HlyD family secretion protein [Candidatus Tisiphia endosymbiont of Nemotelus uliginosus]|uniref:HlyD family secretion protein n=1 Tax=Candidatus Tisiphia endosymbiont of Nemotelus uliginosus TaxID=3077926 RepID=UPI0035C9143F